MIYSIIFYGKELTCHIVTDALIYNHRSFFVNHYLNHVKFIFIWLAMTNKMAAKDLFYAQGLPSYGDSKHAR